MRRLVCLVLLACFAAAQGDETTNMTNGESLEDYAAARGWREAYDGLRVPEMVEIPAGFFLMGASKDEEEVALATSMDTDELPQRKVTIERFAMSAYEVTFDEYDRFARATGRDLPRDGGWGRGKQPAINVTWQDAYDFAMWLSWRTGSHYRLPTEAEWEYAARAGTTTRYWWGEILTDLPKVENSSGCLGVIPCRANCNWCFSLWDNEQTAPVGSFDANPFGLYDTVGNVGEWTQDCYHESYHNAPTDGRAWGAADGGDCSKRVFRGGAWNQKSFVVRVANRRWNITDDNGSMSPDYNTLGFRLAKDL